MGESKDTLFEDAWCKKALEGMNKKLRRSTRTKKPVQRLVYDSYVACHCAYMAKIV